MELNFKLLLSEKERDLIIDLIEHRTFLIRAKIDEKCFKTASGGYGQHPELRSGNS